MLRSNIGGGGFAHPYLWKPGVVDEGSVEIRVIPELASGDEYRGSWGDPRKIVAVAKNDPDKDRENQVQTTQTTLETIADTARTVGRTGFEFFVEAASSLGGLFDINPNNPAEEPEDDPFRRRIKPKKKKRGIRR